MTVKIPPSPSAEEAPEYAQRLKEVRGIAHGKKPTRRKRKCPSGASATDNGNDQVGQASVGKVVSLDAMRKKDSLHNAACESKGEHARPFSPSPAEKRSTIAPGKAATGTREETGSAPERRDKVIFPRAATPQPRQTVSAGAPALSHIALASAAISGAVAVIVSFAAQGLASQTTTNGVLLLSAVLHGLGLGA